MKKKEEIVGSARKHQKPVLLNDGYVQRRINVEDIVYAKADRVNCHIVFADGKKVTVTQPLKTVHAALPSDMFMRIGRSEIINIWQVESIRGTAMTMNTGEVLHISDAHKDMLKEHFTLLKVK